MRFTLYGHHESGNASKVALMLRLCGAPFEYRHVAIFEGGAKTPEFKRDVNRFGEVPVLVDGEAEGGPLTIVQSGAILWHLAEELGRFGAGTHREQLRLLEWIAWENHRLLMGVARLRFLKRFTKEPPEQLVRVVETWAVQALDVLDGELASRAFLAGEAPTIADIACCPYIFRLDEAGLDIARWPRCGEWLARLAALPGFVHPRDILARA